MDTSALGAMRSLSQIADASPTLAFRDRVLHPQVKTVVFLCPVNKEIFQSVRPIGWWQRFFADLAIKQVARYFRLRAYANEVVARGASRAHEIGSFSHD